MTFEFVVVGLELAFSNYEYSHICNYSVIFVVMDGHLHYHIRSVFVYV